MVFLFLLHFPIFPFFRFPISGFSGFFRFPIFSFTFHTFHTFFHIGGFGTFCVDPPISYTTTPLPQLKKRWRLYYMDTLLSSSKKCLATMRFKPHFSCLSSKANSWWLNISVTTEILKPIKFCRYCSRERPPLFQTRWVLFEQTYGGGVG